MRRRGARGVTTGKGGSHLLVALGSRQGAAPGLWGASEAALWCLASSWRKNNSRKFSSSSENIFRSKFSEKQETGTRHFQ